MNNNTDMRVVKSRNAIKNAFLDLMEEKGYANVSVTDIAKRAQINRKTFYIHYETKEILYNTIVDEFIEVLSPTLEDIPRLKGKMQRRYIEHLLDKFKEYKRDFNVLINDNTNSDFANRLKKKFNYDIISKTHITEKTRGTNFTPELLMEAYFYLFMVFARWWVNSSDITTGEVVDMIVEFFSLKTLEFLGVDFTGYEKTKI